MKFNKTLKFDQFGIFRTKPNFTAFIILMPKAEDLQKQKEQLIERLGVHKENQEQLAPLAARIFATLILNGEKGITFEELVKDLNASKSTVCTHLNTLQASGRASYFTKPGDRKRYFTVPPNYIIQVMDEMIEKWDNQKKIHQDIMNYKSLMNDNLENGDTPFDLEFHTDYLGFLEEAGKSIENLKEKIIRKHLKDE